MYCIYPISHNFTAVIAGYTISSRPISNLWAILPGVVSSCNVRIDSHILQSSPCGGCLLQICSTASLKPFSTHGLIQIFCIWTDLAKIGSIPTSKGLQHSSYRNNVVYNIAGAAFSGSHQPRTSYIASNLCQCNDECSKYGNCCDPARSQVIGFNMNSLDRVLTTNTTHRIHVWYIYANIWGILMVNVTIYGIHGSYGLSIYIFYLIRMYTLVYWNVLC